MRSKTILVSLLLLTSLLGATQFAHSAEWQFFSDKSRAFPTMIADPREAQTRVGWLYQNNHQSFMDMGLGGDLGLARKDISEDTELSITVRGLFAPRFRLFSKSYDLFNTDFIGGLALAYRSGRSAWEFVIYHQSSHLGDDVMSEGRVPINFSLETIRLAYSYQVSPSLRLYAGPETKVRADPSRYQGKLTLRVGSEWHFLSSLPSLFAAMDLQLRQQHNWSPNLSAQIGYELGDRTKVKKFQRIFMEFFSGHSNMGQYTEDHETYLLLAMGFTF